MSTDTVYNAGVRVDSWIERGTTISPHYDSLLAKLMVFAPDRPAATKKMSNALGETQVSTEEVRCMAIT